MPDRRDDDARLQRLADLSIEIRMLKARVQAALEEQVQAQPVDEDGKLLPFRAPLTAASCPHCGHAAGLALLPREYRRLSTLVRCFGCHRDSTAFDWVATNPHAVPADTRRSGNARF